MQRMLPISLCLTGIMACGCQSSPSTVKELNEKSAKALISEHLQNQQYRFSLGNVLPASRTLADHTSSEGIIKRMIDAKMMLQTVQTEQYPKISGTFKARWDAPPLKPGEIGGTRWREQFWTLESVQGSNRVVGTYGEQVDVQTNPSIQRAEGTVEPDGKVDLRNMQFSWQARVGTYREQGDKAFLEFPGEQLNPYVGKPSNAKVTIKWFTYAWAPEFQRQIEGAGDNSTIVGGNVEVEDVSGLRLLADTEAHAGFGWHVNLNGYGKAFFGDKPTVGKGEATFGKKPDGTWFVDQISQIGARSQKPEGTN